MSWLTQSADYSLSTVLLNRLKAIAICHTLKRNHFVDRPSHVRNSGYRMVLLSVIPS